MDVSKPPEGDDSIPKKASLEDEQKATTTEGDEQKVTTQEEQDVSKPTETGDSIPKKD